MLKRVTKTKAFGYPRDPSFFITFSEMDVCSPVFFQLIWREKKKENFLEVGKRHLFSEKNQDVK